MDEYIEVVGSNDKISKNYYLYLGFNFIINNIYTHHISFLTKRTDFYIR